NKDEIVRYLKAGRTKSVCVDRCLCNTYPGYVRDITIRDQNMINVEFNIYGYNEGGLLIEITYDRFDILLSSVGKYIDKSIDKWKNINKTGWYPTIEQEIDFNDSGIKLELDLAEKKLSLPKGGNQYTIPSDYWRDIAEGKIDIIE
ncbi:MAG: hypothetical protein GY756_15995, partial [bacterium]|nr:hypothetical protein [bacterium]